MLSTTRAMLHLCSAPRGGSASCSASCRNPCPCASSARPRSRYVEDGVLDAGICGHDWVMENGADVVEVAELTYSKAGWRGKEEATRGTGWSRDRGAGWSDLDLNV